MKIAPIIKAIKKVQQGGNEIEYRLVHTGQHYDKKMSGDFLSNWAYPIHILILNAEVARRLNKLQASWSNLKRLDGKPSTGSISGG
jgi:UDP-N-acetylglucosamine 2-epimerase